MRKNAICACCPHICSVGLSLVCISAHSNIHILKHKLYFLKHIVFILPDQRICFEQFLLFGNNYCFHCGFVRIIFFIWSGNESFMNFFPFLPSPGLMDFTNQGSDPSCSCDLCCSCGSARSSNSQCWAGHPTCILALQRCSWSHCTTAETPIHFFPLTHLSEKISRNNIKKKSPKTPQE